MSVSSGSDLARAGRRLRGKVLVALVLASGVPMFALIVVLPTLGTGISQVLIILTIVSTLSGAWVIWDLGRVLARFGAMMASESALSGYERRRDEVGTLMTSFNKLLVTTEQQAAEINTFATRLDAAYKEMESTNARLKETSFKDDLTSLYNRRFVLLRLEEEIGRWSRFSQPCSLVLLEPEGLRVVADTAGYAAHNEALIIFAQVLMTPARSVVDVLARYDGNRFAVLLVKTHREGALRFVQLVRKAVASQYPHSDEILLRIGVASTPEDGADAFELMSAADTALRRSLPVD
jgi:diguanylate cyclase (GGDEF)-like protein